jgi:hypothetical protein
MNCQCCYCKSRLSAAKTTQTIDARGSTQDVISRLPEILEANSRRTLEMTKAAIHNDLKRYGRIRADNQPPRPAPPPPPPCRIIRYDAPWTWAWRALREWWSR